MYRFDPQAPLEVVEYPEPAVTDRSGPPLTQGIIFMLISTTASEHCSPEILALFDQIKPESWYHGQLLESVLNSFETQKPQLVVDIGKNIYYTLEGQFRAAGVQSPTDVITTMPNLWQNVTRGASGEWRTSMIGPREARIEMEQPYNCHFEEGAIQGAMECFDASNVTVAHSQCIRDDAPYCALHITWQE
ncbi:MAG: hypothetical protein H0T53_06505 [Herpetosiphonaceae bacterium]|nr:hypothetical protein [Herpetosiphonaceae bacterium]